MTETVTVHVIISGRVQGVGYRAWTASNARKLSLDGWVRNRTDGTVEAVFHGPADQVDKMITACNKGPLAAKVTDIWQQDVNDSVELGFVQRDTI